MTQVKYVTNMWLIWPVLRPNWCNMEHLEDDSFLYRSNNMYILKSWGSKLTYWPIGPTLCACQKTIWTRLSCQWSTGRFQFFKWKAYWLDDAQVEYLGVGTTSQFLEDEGKLSQRVVQRLQPKQLPPDKRTCEVVLLVLVGAVCGWWHGMGV